MLVLPEQGRATMQAQWPGVSGRGSGMVPTWACKTRGAGGYQNVVVEGSVNLRYVSCG